MKQQYIDILENASGPTIDEFLGRNMQVYSVGEFCQHEGGGWDVLVADNENTFANIKKVLIDHHVKERNRYIVWSIPDENESEEANKRNTRTCNEEISGHNEIIELIKNANCIEDINNKEIPSWNHDVIRINKQTIIS